jgi:hypothetical protein
VQHLINVHFTHPAAFAAMRTRPAMLYVPSAPVFVPEPSEGRRTLHLHPRQVFCIQPRCDRGPRQSRPRTGGVLFPYPTSSRATSVAPSQRTSALLIPSPRMRACQPDSDFPWYSVVLRCRVPHLIDVKVRLSSPMHLVGCTMANQVCDASAILSAAATCRRLHARALPAVRASLLPH